MTADELADQLLQESREELTRADNKASLILAAASVVVALILGGAVAGDLTLSDQPRVVVVLAAVAAVAVTIGIVFIAVAVFPRTGTGVQGRARYFADIDQCEREQQVAVALSFEVESPGLRTREQLLVLSGAVATKYAWTQRSMIALALGFTLAGVAALLSL